MQSAEIALSKPDIDPKDFLTPFGMLRLKNVAIGRLGKFTDMNGNEIEFTRDVMEDIVQNFGKPDQHVPRAHLGHPAYFMGEQPTFAEVERISFDGKYLRADYKNVPFYMAGQLLPSGSYPNRSMELRRDDGSWRLTGVGHLGSSMPGIEGMPPISLSDAAWMDSEEFQFSAPAEDCIFGLRSTQSDTEVSMSETKNPSDATGGGADVAALQAQHEEQMRKLQAEHEAKLAAAAKKAREEAEAKYGADIAELKLANAKSDVNSFCTDLRKNSKATTAQFEEGNLADILLHARLNCPDMKLADGSSVSMFSALKGVLEMNVSGPVQNGARFTSEADGNTPVAPDAAGHKNTELAAEVRKYMADHDCDWDTAARKVASTRGGK